ncbi:hypothetical protein, partial [Wolbachia endosymbiont of Pentidionis agamae]|uniref:hypothetical protein n=1 Tax=Wolbachia endosymbiont of Pentidionis agamae TaxID=3110435 RepID=UPI002FD5371D
SNPELAFKSAAVKSGISVRNINFDCTTLQSEIREYLINGEFSKISKALHLLVDKTCQSIKQRDKFLGVLKSNIEKILDEPKVINDKNLTNDQNPTKNSYETVNVKSKEVQFSL